MRRLTLLLTAFLAACTPATVPSGTTATAALPIEGTHVTIDAVLDGDSVRVDQDGTSIEVRLLGINAPERGECWADEAREALSVALEDGGISLVGDETDQYGRLLGYLHSDTSNINRYLVINGHAIAIAVAHEDLPDFLAAEEEAIALERGLWNPTACGSSADRFDVRIWAIEPDAPGRDDRNPNGEFVALTNEGPDADLSGWMLRDESSAHRYRFPDGFVLTTGEIITVRSGCGVDARPDIYWCADGTVWTNSGDTVLLLDDFGAVVDRVRYLEE